MNEDMAFHSLDKLIYPDTCHPLKQAHRKGDIELSAIGRGSYPGRKLKTKDLPGIRSIGIWDAKKEQDFGLPLHQNEGLELTLCEAGHVSFYCDNREEILKSDMMTITRPWQPHKLGNPNIQTSRLHWIILDVGVRRPHQEWIWPEWMILDKKDLLDLTAYLRGNESPVWHANTETVTLFKRITSLVQQYGQLGISSSLKLLLNELFLNIFLQMKEQVVSIDQELSTTERNMELFFNELPNMLQYNWNSQNMAEYCRLKSTRFIYYCKKQTNMSPIQYLHYIRIKKAKSLLKNSRESITDIAFECGFSSCQYFNRIFKKITDTSPVRYRKMSQ